LAPLIGAWRLLRVLLHVLHAAAICAFVFPIVGPEARRGRVGWFAQRMLRLLSIELTSHVALETRGAASPRRVGWPLVMWRAR